MPRGAYEWFGNAAHGNGALGRAFVVGKRVQGGAAPCSLGGETPDFFTWVGRAAHGGHAVRTLSREGDAATVTRRRTDVPQWYQGAGMNGSDLEKNRDVHSQTP